MAKEEVILIFDVGKTHKKMLLFDRNLKVVREEEYIFQETLDDEGFPCDDAEKLEQWIGQTIEDTITGGEYLVKGINFTSYGATLVYLDKEGKRLTPVYNYLKPLPEEAMEGFYDRYGGEEAFSRQTASPVLGMLNSGLQLLWLKRKKPEVFAKVAQILHFPQYLSRLVHGQVVSEHTSIGCHTMMWDFERMAYHSWLKEEGISLPPPAPVSESFLVDRGGILVESGVGIHDSSSALAPYLMAAAEPFILVSTGTWCINMNPFNQDPLSREELRKDCLCFLGVHGKAVKSSRFFLGRIHDLNVERILEHFSPGSTAWKNIQPGIRLISEYWKQGKEGQLFFRNGIPEGRVDTQADPGQFGSFEEAYTRLMVDLSVQVVKSIELILPGEDRTKHLYISGGFARNPIFRTILCLAFPGKQVYTSEIDNASSLGAALVISAKIWKEAAVHLDLGLREVKP
ncbi:MAG: FGGY family carbohydrate kinase [Bacteroidales bacterium]|nr:FGGY family carbohydrate kinase [Bacteroidales bacterium]